jgi:hypothetical protein
LSSVSHANGIPLHIFTRSYAIKGSPNQKLLLEDIYYAIESRVWAFNLWYENTLNHATFILVSLFPYRTIWVEGKLESKNDLGVCVLSWPGG